MFVVFGHTGTTWLAEWLAEVTRLKVAYNLQESVSTVEGFLTELISRKVVGTIETTGIELLPLLQKHLPQCRVGIIEDSEALWPDVDLVERIDYRLLQDPIVAAGFLAHLLPGLGFNRDLWAVHVPWCPGKEEILTGSPLASDLQDWVAGADRDFIWFGPETALQLLPDARALGLNVNIPYLVQREAAGHFWCQAVRRNGRLIGYCLWEREIPLEIDRHPTVVQGPCLVQNATTMASLLAQAIEQFRSNGFQELRCNQPKFMPSPDYRALGLYESGREYNIRLTDEQASLDSSDAA